MTSKGFSSNRVLRLIYVMACGILMNGDSLGLPWYAYLIFYAMTASFAFSKFLVTYDKNGLGRIAKCCAVYAGQMLIILMVSLWVWCMAVTPATYVFRGISRVMWQSLSIIFVLSAAYVYGEDAISLTFWGFAFGNAITLALTLKSGGMAVVSELIDQAKTLGTADLVYAKKLELHDLAMSFSAFWIYFVVRHKDVKHPVVKLLVCSLFIFTGFKRTAIISMLICTGIYFIAEHLSKDILRAVVIFTAIIAVIGSFYYIISIKDGNFSKTVDENGIDTMGREYIYNEMSNYYDVSPGYTGMGAGWTTRTIEGWYKEGKISHNFNALHNDILTMYIELGFLGFILWILYTTAGIPLLIGKMCGEEGMAAAFVIGSFVFITYLTDNTSSYAAIQSAVRLIPVCIVVNGKEEIL